MWGGPPISRVLIGRLAEQRSEGNTFGRARSTSVTRPERVTLLKVTRMATAVTPTEGGGGTFLHLSATGRGGVEGL